MTKYDMIYESLVEKVNNEELTLEEANELNELAFEKYGESEIEDSVTLEEAMDIISDYLTEAKGDSPEVKALKKEVKKAYKRDEAIKNSRKNAENLVDDKKDIIKDRSNSALNDAHRIADDKINRVKSEPSRLNHSSRSLEEYLNKNDKENRIKKIEERRQKNLNNIEAKRKMLEKYNKRGRLLRASEDDDDFIASGKGKSKRVHMYKAVRTESVNDLRLQVYEAYDAGLIEESTKDLFLDYLNLENYE